MDWSSLDLCWYLSIRFFWNAFVSSWWSWSSVFLYFETAILSLFGLVSTWTTNLLNSFIVRQFSSCGVWDDEDTIKAITDSKGCGCKGAKCDGSTAGCRNCYRICKPCNRKCKCKGNCRNPHNNGGTCARCEQDESDDGGGTDDEEAAPETLPLVTRSADMVDSSTDSDDSEHDSDDT